MEVDHSSFRKRSRPLLPLITAKALSEAFENLWEPSSLCGDRGICVLRQYSTAHIRKATIHEKRVKVAQDSPPVHCLILPSRLLSSFQPRACATEYLPGPLAAKSRKTLT